MALVTILRYWQDGTRRSWQARQTASFCCRMQGRCFGIGAGQPFTWGGTQNSMDSRLLGCCLESVSALKENPSRNQLGSSYTRSALS